MTWSTITCLGLSFVSAGLLTAAAPPRLRRAAAGGLSWVASVALAAGLVLQLQAPATAHSAAQPMVVMLAIGADGQELLPPLEVIPEEAPLAVEAADTADTAEAPGIPAESLSDLRDDLPAASPAEQESASSTTEGTKRRVQLPADFAAQTVVIPPRPDWVDRDPESIDGDYYQPVSSAMQVHERNCKASLDERLTDAVHQYIRDYVGSDKATYFIHYDVQEIRSRFVQTEPEFQEFNDVVEVSFGQMQPMHQSHALLKFTPDFHKELDAKWGQILQTGRVVRTGGMAVGVLVVMALMFGYFRLDTATKGYYTRRLQMVLGAAILAVAAMGILYFKTTAQLIYNLTM